MTVSEVVQNPGHFNDLRQLLLRIVKEYRRFCNGAGLTDKAKQRGKLSKALQTSNMSVVDLWAILVDSIY